MHACFFAVYENSCFIVCRTDMKNGALCRLFFGKRKDALIPNAVNKVLMTYAGEFGLNTERNGNLLVEGIVTLVNFSGFAASAVIETESPFAVKVHPVFSFELRFRVFRPGNTHVFTSFFQIFYQ